MNETLFSTHRYRRYYQSLTPVFKSRQVHAYLMVVLSLLTISFFGFFAIKPTLKTIATLQRQISDRTFVNQKLEDKINALIAAQEEYQRLGNILPLIYTLLPERAEFPTLLRKLELLTDQNQATISGIQFDPIILYGQEAAARVQPTDTTNPNIVVQTTPVFFTLNLRGHYQNLVTFLDQLTKLDRLITIHSVDISSARQGGDSELNLGIESRAYYYPNSLHERE